MLTKTSAVLAFIKACARYKQQGGGYYNYKAIYKALRRVNAWYATAARTGALSRQQANKKIIANNVKVAQIVAAPQIDSYMVNSNSIPVFELYAYRMLYKVFGINRWRGMQRSYIIQQKYYARLKKRGAVLTTP